MLVRPSKDLEHKLMKPGGSQSHLARDCTEAGPVGGGGSGYSAGGNGGSGWGSAGGNAYGGGGGGGGGLIAPPVVHLKAVKAAMAAAVATVVAVVVVAAGVKPVTTVVSKAICRATALLSQALNASATNASNLATFSLLARLRRLAGLPAENLFPFSSVSQRTWSRQH
ncbi:hypothetical protein LTR92_006441 [Exophiala xenobiotica]|nr:hypothetical protein LTR92_006441 [Exophiala xenobiotica]